MLLLLIVELGSRVFGLPGPEALISLFENAYRNQPVLVILLGAFLETTFMVGLYLPGSFVIFLAVYFSRAGGPTIPEIIVLSGIGVFSALAANYAIGRFGLARFFRWLGADLAVDNMRSFMQHRRGLLVTFLTGAHPNFIGIAMVVNGIARVPSHRALATAAAAVAVWVPAMIIVASAIVEQLHRNAESAPYLIVSVLLLWAIVGATYDALTRRRRSRAGASK